MKIWDLIGNCDFPLGNPIPETIEIAEMEKEDPPSGDAVGTGDAIALPNGYILLAHKRYHSSLPGRNMGRKYESGEPTEIRRSRDGGRTWEFLGGVDPETAHDMTQCLVHPNNSPDEFVRIFIEREGRFLTYCSYNAGETWREKGLLFDYCDFNS